MRTTSIGWQLSGSLASNDSIERSTRRLARSRWLNNASSASVGNSPRHSRKATCSKLQRAARSWTGYPR
ncbi:Uncharacterised protein [Mycobacterium tuberculosis]|nr:Uncharacterised protein [Mycobacterium tuberculosis]COX26007.1 Uncharacterised protein [Mycobacterium tuberculosis]SGO40765.1 Uncharacterised protein [Mycobacterium tuberculosis]